jgi:hypothetical protein
MAGSSKGWWRKARIGPGSRGMKMEWMEAMGRVAC